MLGDTVVGHEVRVTHVALVVGEVDGAELAADFVEGNGSLVKHLLVFVVMESRKSAIFSLQTQGVSRRLQVHDQHIEYIIFFQPQISGIIATGNRTCIVLVYFTWFLNNIRWLLRRLHMLRRVIGRIVFAARFSFIDVHYLMRVKNKLLAMFCIIQTYLGQIVILVVVFNRHYFLLHLEKGVHICVMVQNRIQNFVLFIKIWFKLFFDLIFQNISLMNIHTVHH